MLLADAREDGDRVLPRAEGLEVAAERAPGEDPERLVVTNDGALATLSDGLLGLEDVLNGPGHEEGWALVGLSRECWGGSGEDGLDLPEDTWVLYVTVAPLKRPLGRALRSPRQQISHEILRRIIVMREVEGKGARRIANALTEAGIPSPHGKPVWGASTVASVLQAEYYQAALGAWQDLQARKAAI